MNPVEVLEHHRPATEPPTVAERSAARDELMGFIATQADARNAVVTPVPRRRRVRLAGMVALAATIAVLALVVSATGHGPASLQPTPSAAEQLRTIAAMVETSNPYPDPPYALQIRTDLQVEVQPAGALPSHQTVEVTEYILGGDDFVTHEGCSDQEMVCSMIHEGLPGVTLPDDGTAAQVRAAVEAVVDRSFRATRTPRAETTVSMVEAGLRQPAMSTTGRAELLRLLADTPGVTAEPNVANAYGLAGTRFTFTTPDTTTAVIIDPADGYVLATSDGPTTDPNTTTTTASPNPGPVQGEGVIGEAESYRRPVSGKPLPDAVAKLADELADHRVAIDNATSPGGCTGESAGGTGWGFTVPPGYDVLHCKAR
jgi:hypothetical protein